MMLTDIQKTLEDWLQNQPNLPLQSQLDALEGEWLSIRAWMPKNFQSIIDDRIAQLRSAIDRQNF